MLLLTRADLRTTGVVSLRFSETLSGTISRVLDSHIDDSSFPARSCNSATSLLFIGFNWFSKVFDLIGSLKCSSHEILVGMAPNLLEIPWLPYHYQV